ncbi:hypothetical protein [Paraburkholderia terrae]
MGDDAVLGRSEYSMRGNAAGGLTSLSMLPRAMQQGPLFEHAFINISFSTRAHFFRLAALWLM